MRDFVFKDVVLVHQGGELFADLFTQVLQAWGLRAVFALLLHGLYFCLEFGVIDYNFIIILLHFFIQCRELLCLFFQVFILSIDIEYLLIHLIENFLMLLTLRAIDFTNGYFTELIFKLSLNILLFILKNF